MKIIDPTYDAGFKLLFGREDVSEDVLKELLNSIFEGDPELSDIVSVSYMNPEKGGELEGVRGIRYDILCQTGSGHRFIVEMQKSWQRYFVKRAEYYYARAVAEQGFGGKNDQSLTWDYNYVPVVGVYICQQRIKGLEPKLITRCRLTDEETGQPIGSTVRFVYIQLPFVKEAEADCENYFEEWTYNIKNMGRTQEVAFQSKRAIFHRLAEIAKVSSLNAEQARIYEADIKIARDYYNELEGARIEGREQGREQGLEEGRQLGLEQGRAQGLEQGRAQGLEQGLEQGREQGLVQGREQGLVQGREQGLVQGREQGLKEGRKEGAWGKLREIVMNLRAKGMDNPTIASFIGETPDVIASI